MRRMGSSTASSQLQSESRLWREGLPPLAPVTCGSLGLAGGDLALPCDPHVGDWG